MATIAWIGLGNMGGPMTANLVEAGHDGRRIRPLARARMRLLPRMGFASRHPLPTR